MKDDKTPSYMEVYGSTRTIYEPTQRSHDLYARIENLIIENQALRNAANGFKAMAEKAINDIYSVRRCAICAHNTGSWNARCESCDRNSNAYHPDFKWRGEEDNHDYDAK